MCVCVCFGCVYVDLNDNKRRFTLGKRGVQGERLCISCTFHVYVNVYANVCVPVCVRICECVYVLVLFHYRFGMLRRAVSFCQGTCECWYMYSYIYIHTYIYVCIHTYIYVCIHTYIHTFAYSAFACYALRLC